MDCADVRLQGAGRPERHALAVLARVIPVLLVHRLDVRLQVALNSLLWLVSCLSLSPHTLLLAQQS